MIGEGQNRRGRGKNGRERGDATRCPSRASEGLSEQDPRAPTASLKFCHLETIGFACWLSEDCVYMNAILVRHYQDPRNQRSAKRKQSVMNLTPNLRYPSFLQRTLPRISSSDLPFVSGIETIHTAAVSSK